MQDPAIGLNFDATTSFFARNAITLKGCVVTFVLLSYSLFLLFFFFFSGRVLLFELILPFSRIFCRESARWRRRLFCFIRAREQRENSFTFSLLRTRLSSTRQQGGLCGTRVAVSSTFYFYGARLPRHGAPRRTQKFN